MKFLPVSIPTLSEDDFVHGDGFVTYAKHPLAGYPQFMVDAYGYTFHMILTNIEPIPEMLGSYQVYEYIEEESEMVAFIGLGDLM